MAVSNKRFLYVAPSRPAKRAKLAPRRRRQMTLPKRLLPETKQYSSSYSYTSSTNYAYVNMPIQIIQGDKGDERIGAKMRVLRIRVHYDFSQLTLTDGVRVSVVIPKNTSRTPSLTSNVDVWDTRMYTVLHDMLLPDDPAALAGMFDVKGPINVGFDEDGTSIEKNAIFLYMYSAGNGTGMGTVSAARFTMWYTDA